MSNKYQVKTDVDRFKTLGPTSITFIDNNGVLVGTLTLSDPMTFTGNVEESAKSFFEYICTMFKIPSNIVFTSNSVTVCTLSLSDPMTFDGNVDDCARILFEYICNNFKINDKNNCLLF
jgi:hypothetical protein